MARFVTIILAVVGLFLQLVSCESEKSQALHRPGRRLLTRVSYIPSRREEHHVVIRPRKRRRRLRPAVRVIAQDHHTDILDGPPGSYRAIAGHPHHGSVHIVNNVPSLGSDSITVVNGVKTIKHHHGHHNNIVPIPKLDHHPVVRPGVVRPLPIPYVPAVVPTDRLPLPKCSYINTEFVGDDLDVDGESTGLGINAGSARACKSRCRLEDRCNFWTYKEGNSRNLVTKDCFLKVGTPGLPVPREAVPRLGFVSGTQDNNCICIKSEDEEDEVCPIKDPRGLVYPWRSLSDEENDLEAGLPPLGWNRGVYGGLDPRLGSVLGARRDPVAETGLLQAQVDALKDQLDLLSRRLGAS